MTNEYTRLAVKASGATLEELNSILEFQVNKNHEIVVKQCSHMIEDKQNVNGLRHGRFQFKENEHRVLQQHEGLYLFIVHYLGLYSQMRFMEAQDLGFARLIAWPTIWTWTESEKIEGDIFMWCDKVPNFILDEEDHKHGL